MAEARAMDGLSATITNEAVMLHTDGYGVHFHLNISIPRPQLIGVLLKKRIKAIRSTLFNIFYPLGLLVMVTLTTALITIVQFADADSMWRNGSIANLAWDIAQLFPWLAVPLMLRVGIVTMFVGIVLSLILALVQRFLLQLLLSWHGWMYTPAKQVSRTTQVWGALVKLLGGQYTPKWILERPLLYSFARVLPILPLPPLESTVEKYLESVQPLLTEDEFTARTQQAQDFLEQEGPQLQRYLYFKWLTSTNYITDWWERYVYLRGRTSLQINSNYYIMDCEPAPPTPLPEARGACVLRMFLQYMHDVEDQSIEPMMIRGVVPLCMEQHRRMFFTTRIPGREMDTLRHHEMTQHRHVIVICKGNYYRLDCYHGHIISRKTLLSARQLEAQLATIRADAARHADTAQTAAGRVAAMTSENRTRWAEVREGHLLRGTNKRTLAIVESAMLVLVLDDDEPATVYDAPHKLLCGTGANRWFDKSITFVVFNNGRCGINAEHSWADALVMAHLWEHSVLSASTLDVTGYDKATGHCIGEVGNLQHQWETLKWDVPAGGELEEAINAAYLNAINAGDDLDLTVCTFKTFGKGLIKKMKVSPDSLVQMAFQLAYYRDQNKTFGLTYEASMVRLFRLGRTETIRSLSNASTKFVLAMESPTATAQEKFDLLRVAVEGHVIEAKNAMTGKGIDRHLFGLYVVANGKGIESNFLRDAISQPWMLSTSQQPQKQTNLWDPERNEADMKRLCPGGGFGPVADNGYGVSYMIVDTYISLHVSSKLAATNTDSKRFRDEICKALEELKDLHERVQQGK